jgi:hypothetical protein
VMKKPLDIDNLPIYVPSDVEDCPYCGSELMILGVSEWNSEEVFEIELECADEPSIDDTDEWDDWWKSHEDMPYVYWMPAQENVLQWLNDNYFLVSSRKDKEKLDKWIRSCEG